MTRIKKEQGDLGANLTKAGKRTRQKKERKAEKKEERDQGVN